MSADGDLGRWMPSVCPHDCPSACALEIEKLSPTKIGRVRGLTRQPYTDGVICAKVARYAERAHDPERLTEPLLRVSPKGAAAQFEPISWDAALDRLVAELRRAADTAGPESVWPYYYGGTMGEVQQKAITRLARTCGYSGLKRTFCVQIAYDGWRAGAGSLRGSDPRELQDSRLIILWGCNAAATQVNVMHHISIARKGGAKLVVIDPYRNATARVADLHLAPRPGTDGALACALMQQLFEKGLADPDYLQRYTDAPEALAEHLKTRDPEWAQKITGIPAARISELADLYGHCPNSYIRLGIGFSRQRNGAVNVHAVSCLPAITGAWRHKGGGALLSTGDVFALKDEALAGIPDDSVRQLDMSQIGRVLCGDRQALQGGAPVNVLMVQNSNPMLVAPELHRVREGLGREDLFTCVHEQFMTETAELADLVLPATMFVEHDDLYRSYGHTFLQYGPQVIEPPGQCRANHELICELERRLGVRPAGDRPGAAELAADSLSQSGYPALAGTKAQTFHDCSPGFEAMHFLDGFGWPDGRFRFRPDWAALGPQGKAMPQWPDHWAVIDDPDSEHPLRLVAAPAKGYLNSTFNRSPSSLKREKRPHVKIHPDTAERLSIEDGQVVQIGNRLGSVTLAAQYTAGIQPDTVVVEGIWRASAFPEGIGINALISAEPAAPNGGAVFHDTAVWVKAAEPLA